MTISQQAVATARSFLGYTEGANNDTIFGKEFGLNFVAWCVEFVDGIYSRSGLRAGEDYPATASSGEAVSWYKKNNLFNASGSGYTPRAGDSVFFWDGSAVYHTGIVEAVENGFVKTIEGNAGPGSDSVVSGSYSLTDPKLYGFGSPRNMGLGAVSIANSSDSDYTKWTPSQWAQYIKDHSGWILDPKMSDYYWRNLKTLDPATENQIRKNFPGSGFTRDLAALINGDMTSEEWLASNLLPLGLALGGGILIFMGVNFLFGGSAVEIITQSVKGATE